jgi:hypothetical protein
MKINMISGNHAALYEGCLYPLHMLHVGIPTGIPIADPPVNLYRESLQAILAGNPNRESLKGISIWRIPIENPCRESPYGFL